MKAKSDMKLNTNSSFGHILNKQKESILYNKNSSLNKKDISSKNVYSKKNSIAFESNFIYNQI